MLADNKSLAAPAQGALQELALVVLLRLCAATAGKAEKLAPLAKTQAGWAAAEVCWH